VEIVHSVIPFDYQTIKVTQSRIEKGLLAVPSSLADVFPKEKHTIWILNDDGSISEKNYTSYTSSTRECRIGGFREFYNKFSIKDGDELVIQKIDEGVFRILPEQLFFVKVKSTLASLESSQDNETIERSLQQIAKITNANADKIIENEFIKLSSSPVIPEREIKNIGKNARKESVPYFLRNILRVVYNGRCQLTNFSFIMQNGDPYFEIHHIIPEKGNHLKNLLVVSPNVHKQFTYAKVYLSFDDENWLRSVKFNEDFFNVFQKIDYLQKCFQKEIHN
jgi:hypothetical protein